MKNKLFGFASVVSVLILVLTGCQKLEMTSKVSPDGSVSGTVALKLPLVGIDLAGEDVNYDELVESIKSVEISNITIGAIEGCTLTNVTFLYLGTNIEHANGFTFGHVTQKRSDSIFVRGSVTSIDGNALSAESATVIPASGDASDCAKFAEIETGELAYSAYVDGGWQLGNISNPSDTGDLAGLGIFQLAHLPLEDRPLAIILAEVFGSRSNVANMATTSSPELIACGNFLSSSRFNSLNYRTFVAGEFKALVRTGKRMDVSTNNSIITVKCNYEDVSLEFLDRSANEISDNLESPNPDGRWLKSNDDLFWNFTISSNDGREYSEVLESDPSSIIEFESRSNLSDREKLIWDFIEASGYSQTVRISGVILDTNGTFKAKNNTVSFKDGYMFYDSDESKYYIIKDLITGVDGFMDALIGRVVTFKVGKSTQTTKSSVISTYAKALKKKSVDSIKLVGIFDGEISSESKRAANEALVAKRVKNLKAQLKKLGVKATITAEYGTTDPSANGDAAAKNKVVIQIVNE
jgi:hypothetical protein